MLQKQKSKLKIRSGLCFKWSERQARRSLRGLSVLKFKSCPSGVFIIKKSERQDLNLRPLPPQGSALPSCATSRFFAFYSIFKVFLSSGLAQLAPPSRTILNRARGVLATSRFFAFYSIFKVFLSPGLAQLPPQYKA